MKTTATPTGSSSGLCRASRTVSYALSLMLTAAIGIPAAMATGHSISNEAQPGSTHVYFPSPGLMPPCECPDVTDLDGDGNTTEWRRCAIINGYNEFQKGCLSIDDLDPWIKLDTGSDSHHVYFPPPGFLPVCRCKDVTDLDGDGNSQEMRACAVINGYNEFQKGCIPIDKRPGNGLGAGNQTLKNQ